MAGLLKLNMLGVGVNGADVLVVPPNRDVDETVETA